MAFDSILFAWVWFGFDFCLLLPIADSGLSHYSLCLLIWKCLFFWLRGFRHFNYYFLVCVWVTERYLTPHHFCLHCKVDTPAWGDFKSQQVENTVAQEIYAEIQHPECRSVQGVTLNWCDLQKCSCSLSFLLLCGKVVFISIYPVAIIGTSRMLKAPLPLLFPHIGLHQPGCRSCLCWAVPECHDTVGEWTTWCVAYLDVNEPLDQWPDRRQNTDGESMDFWM